MSLTIHEPHSDGVSVLMNLREIVVSERTRHQQLVIAETIGYGRALFLDGLIQSAEADEALYHESFVHPALVVHGTPRRVLVAGAGEGATIREVLRHPDVEHVLAVDLDPQVVEACKLHLPQWHAGSFDDPRVELRYEDVQQTLRAAEPGSFDAVFLDITDPVEDGPAVDLFTAKFFAAVSRVLADDGIVVLQAGEIDALDARMASIVHSTLGAVFPWVEFGHRYVPSFHCLWGFALAAKRPMQMSPADLEARIARLPTERLRVYDVHQHRAFCRLPRYLEEMIVAPSSVISGEGTERLVAYSATE